MTKFTRCGLSRSKLVEVQGEQLTEALEPRIPLEVRARVPQGTRHVLNVDRVTPRDRLVTEGPERFQVALQRHEVEPPPEFGGLILPRAALQRQEVRDQVVELAIGDVHVRI